MYYYLTVLCNTSFGLSLYLGGNLRKNGCKRKGEKYASLVHCVDFTMSLSQESFRNGKIFRPLNQNWKFFFFGAEYFLATAIEFPSIVL
jgi:hypothetical protein